MKRFMSFILATTLFFSLTACTSNAPDKESTADKPNTEAGSKGATSGGLAELNFMFWGSPVEKAAVQKSVDTFNTENEGKIKVNAQHVPDDYVNKLATQVAAGTSPDIAYVGSAAAIAYAKEGKLLFVEDMIANDKGFLDGVLPEAQWKFGGKVGYLSTAMESLLITYNKDIFDKYKVAYPPVKSEEALDWDSFVNLCKSVTIDKNEKNALSPDFDSNNIATYGLGMTFSVNTWLPLLASAGGDILNADSTNTALDSPQMIDLMNKIHDLIYVHKVVPSPTVADALSAEAMLTGQIAMTFDGNWSFLDYADQKLNVGCTMFPNLGKGPFTLSAPGVTAMFKDTKFPDATWTFYKYSLDAEKGATELYQNGLWQPIYKEYYTDPTKIDFWVKTPPRPAEYKTVVVDNIEKNALRLPQSYITNWGEISAILTPAIESIYRDEKKVEVALKEAQDTINSSKVYQGRFDK